MPGKIDWENQIGRRLRFRDLHVFFTVVRLGSMAKAAAELGVAPPTVSEVIADLERALGVRLLERGRTDALRPGLAQARDGGIRRAQTGHQGYRILVRSEGRRGAHRV